MTERIAACSCAQLRVVASGEPVRVSMCHCLSCQRIPPPKVSGYESRRHPWVSVPAAEHYD